MAIQKENVTIDVQDIVELLHSGYTWYKKDDLGYGSIQEKFNALDIHIKTIQKHPDLKDVDTIARIFVITNKNKENGGTSTNSVVKQDNASDMGQLSGSKQENARSDYERELSESSNTVAGGRTTEVYESVDELNAFANL